MAATLWTIGHSTRAVEEFINVLQAHCIELLADVRRFPGSRRLPHFAADTLAASVREAGIEYLALPALGGRRRVNPDSPNVAWRHPAFRGYADHMASEEFAGGLTELLLHAEGVRTAIMCAEVLWWRCHRRLIADLLVTEGYDVVHIRDATHSEPHAVRTPAAVRAGRLAYD